MRRRIQGLAVVTSDLSPLPICGDGPQARPRKELVAFHLQSCRKGGMEDEHEPSLQPRTQVTRSRDPSPPPTLRPVRLRTCLGRALWLR